MGQLEWKWWAHFWEWWMTGCGCAVVKPTIVRFYVCTRLFNGSRRHQPTYNNLHRHKLCSPRFCSPCPPRCRQSTFKNFVIFLFCWYFKTSYLALLRSARRVSSSDRLFWRDTGISQPFKLCKKMFLNPACSIYEKLEWFDLWNRKGETAASKNVKIRSNNWDL